MCWFKLADVAEARGDLAEAIRFHGRALAIRRQEIHGEHPDLARSLLALGKLLVQKGKFDRARASLRECLDVRGALFPAEHWQIAEVECVLGACLVGLREFDAAESTLLHAYKALRASRGENDELTQHALQSLVELYDAWNKPTQAEKYRLRQS